MCRIGVHILLALAFISTASGALAQIRLSMPTKDENDPAQCHWSFLVSVVAIGETCFKERDAEAIKVFADLRDRFEAYVKRNSGASDEVMDRERASILQQTLGLIGSGPGSCEKSDWMDAMYRSSIRGLKSPKPDAIAWIHRYLATDRPVTLKACERQVDQL